ncbi:MAG TPA: phytanoyl-CoA dioxygenase family protein [Thermoanaerobaculia bacterium]|nr:phytanoyl-CoA dioxygenase family protein [Thermoanaerobaculia bacterium]
MSKALSAQQIERYQQEGCLFPVAVLSAGEVAYFRSCLETLELRLGGRLKRMDHSHLFFPWAYELATHPRVVDAVEDLLGPDLFIHSTRVFSKPPRDPSYVSWHQDGTYSALNSKPAPSIWIALTASTPENGCVRVIPGSHLSAKLPHRETYAPDNLLNHGEEVQAEVDESQAIDMALGPGEMSIHHVNLIHGSNPNRSDGPRIGFAISFITPAVGQSYLPVLHVRGQRDGAHAFEIVEPPSLDLDAALTAHAEFLCRTGQPPTRLSR